MAGLHSLPRTSPYWIRRVAFSNPASSGPNALRLAVQSLTASTDAPRAIALNRSSSSAILNYCYSTSTKPATNTPASAFAALQTPDISDDTIATAAAAAATTASASTYTKMDPHEVDKESKEGLNDWKLRPPYQLRLSRRRMACALPWWRVADVDLGSGLRLPGAVASSMLETDVIIDFADRPACDLGGMLV